MPQAAASGSTDSDSRDPSTVAMIGPSNPLRVTCGPTTSIGTEDPLEQFLGHAAEQCRRSSSAMRCEDDGDLGMLLDLVADRPAPRSRRRRERGSSRPRRGVVLLEAFGQTGTRASATSCWSKTTSMTSTVASLRRASCTATSTARHEASDPSTGTIRCWTMVSPSLMWSDGWCHVPELDVESPTGHRRRHQADEVRLVRDVPWPHGELEAVEQFGLDRDQFGHAVDRRRSMGRRAARRRCGRHCRPRRPLRMRRPRWSPWCPSAVRKTIEPWSTT